MRIFREGYKPGDVIEYDGDRYVVLRIKHLHVTGDQDRIIDVYCVYNIDAEDVDDIDRNDVDKNSKFLRHVDLKLEELVL